LVFPCFVVIWEGKLWAILHARKCSFRERKAEYVFLYEKEKSEERVDWDVYRGHMERKREGGRRERESKQKPTHENILSRIGFWADELLSEVPTHRSHDYIKEHSHIFPSLPGY
jgi:hypothetical protein